MAREIEERVFLGRQFTTQQFPAMKSVLLLRRILAIVLPPLGTAMGRMEGRDLSTMLDQVAEKVDLGGAVQKLFDALTEAELERLIRDLLALTVVDGQPLMPQFDILFRGKVEEIAPLLVWVFEVNWGSFYERVVGAGRALAARPQTAGKTAKLSVSKAG